MSNSANLGIRTVVEVEGYQRQRMLGGILILRILDQRPESIDQWYQECNRFMGRWQAGQRLRYLHDIRGAEKITIHAMDRVMKVLKRMKRIHIKDARGAILVNNPTLAGLLGAFLTWNTVEGWQIKIFTDEQEAITWLSDENLLPEDLN